MAHFTEGQYGFSVALQGRGTQSCEAETKMRQLLGAVSDADLIKTLKGRGYRVSRGSVLTFFVSAFVGAAVAFGLFGVIGHGIGM